MERFKQLALVPLVLATVLVSCAQPSSGPSLQDQGSVPTVRKRIVAAALGDVFTVSGLLSVGGTGTAQPGIGEVGKLVNSGLTIDNGGVREARLAEAVPTTENGLWKLQPDGRMEMTWRLRPGARWHDGTAVTSEDFLFTAQVQTDRGLAIAQSAIYTYVEGVDAPDPTTVVVRWKSPYIEADGMFGTNVLLPKHILDEPYQADKSTFTQLPYWNRDFVGTGPFRMREYATSSYLIVEANDAFVLGRPKIDEIEVRFIPSPTTSVANILAGAVELTLGRGLSIDQTLAFRDQWRDGRIEIEFGSPTMLGPQHLHPNPAFISDVRFRRALYHALDRQEMANALQGGLVQVAHSGLPANDPTYAAVERSVVRHEYDPRRALELLAGLGYTPVPGGGFRDASGERLAPIQVWSSSTDIYVRTAAAAAGLWKVFGLDTEPFTVPDAREGDLEFRASFPGFEAVATGSGIDNLSYLRRSEVRLRENGFRGRNRGGYVNEELEGLVDRYYVTIPMADRMQLLSPIVNHLTGNVVFMWLFYGGHAMAIHNRLLNVTAMQNTSNAYQWNLRS